MNENQLSGRRHFKSSGLMDLPRFIPWLALPFGIAVLLAGLMFLLYQIGHYYILIVPAIAALAVAGCLRLAVGKGHCRSPLGGVITGVIAGLLLYLGYYYFGMIYHLGPATATHPEILPHYIKARLETDVTRSSHDYGRDNESRPKRNGNVYINWVFFILEFGAVMGFTIAGGAVRSRKPYCEACRRWMSREITHFNPARVDELLNALHTESATALAVLSAETIHATVPNAMLAVEICPSIKSGLRQDCPFYVSLKVTAQAASAPGLDPFETAQGKLLLRTLEINRAEVAALATRFKSLEAIVGTAAINNIQSTVAARRPAPPAGATAIITQLPPEHFGKVMTRRTIWIGNSFAFAALGMMFLGLGLAAWGGITAFPDSKADTVEVTPAKKTFGIALLSVGVVLFVGTAGFFLASPSHFGNRYVLKKLSTEISQRPERLVEPSLAEALFVEIVPKLNWGKMMLENASDVGFLKLDLEKREILFEGDKERWRIPAAAITQCEVEHFVQGQGTAGATKVHFTVIRAHHPATFWEAPIRERTGLGIFQARKRLRSAERLRSAIHGLTAGELGFKPTGAPPGRG